MSYKEVNLISLELLLAILRLPLPTLYNKTKLGDVEINPG